HRGNRARRQELEHSVAVAHGIEAVRRDRGEAELLGERLEVDRKRGAGECRGAQRHGGGARAAVAEPVAVALQHEDVREQMVAEDDGLGALQMRVAGQRRLDRFGGARHERLLDAAQAHAYARHDLAQVQALVQGGLVVAGAPRVQLAADLADQLLKAPLDVGVDVLELEAEREGPGRQLVADRGEPPDDGVALGGGQEPGARERLGPRDAAGDVVRPESPVEGERSSELLGAWIGAGRETAAPELLRLRRAARRSRTAPWSRALARPRLHGRSAAMSSMIRRVTWTRAFRRARKPSPAKQRAGPKRPPIGTRRGM